MTIDDFEALVLAQQPATAPWQPVTDYSFEARKEIEGPHAQLIKDVFQPQHVLDVGCGQGDLMRMLRDAGVADVTGCDKGLQGDSLHYFQCDIGQKKRVTMSPRADLVVCREVLEHLTLLQMRQAIANVCLFSSRFVYVTTRFSSEHDILRVDTHDDLDPTHITIPSKDLIRLLFILEGFRRRADLEDRMDWKHLNRCLVYERVL